MATSRLVAASYTQSSTSYTSVTNGDRMYNNTDNTTYATLQHTRSNNSTAYYLYLHNFNFDSIPSGATVTAFEVKLKARSSGQATGSSYRMSLYHKNGNSWTSISSTTCESDITSSSTPGTYTIPTGDLTWDTMSGYGNNFAIRIPVRRSSSRTAAYIYIYGAEINVTYSTSPARTITTTLTGNGTIEPSGAVTYHDGETYNLTIYPTNVNDTVTATNNGVAVTLTAHTGAQSIEATADSFTTGFSGGTNMNFYTSSSSTGNNFNYAVGHTAANPGSTSSGSGSWTYVKENGSSTNYTGYADFVFDFSSIPVGSTINSVTVQCYGATESTTESTAHSEIILYSGTTQKSTSQKFTSTSNTTITISSPGTWTRDELQSAKLRFVVGYYGGHIFGITWTVNYTPPKYYTYSYTVSGDATIAVTIGGGGSTPILYGKSSGSWSTQYTKVWKKINGTWVEQASSTWSTLFSTSTNYRKMT